MTRTPLRLTLAGACLAGLVAAPPLLGVDTTIRIEGATATVLPETPVAVDPAPFTIADSFDSDRVTLPGDRATAQLAKATSAAGVPLGLQVFSFGTLVDRVGPDDSPPEGSPFWRLKVNDRASMVGGDEVVLAASDRATWAFVSDFQAPELDLRVSRTTAPAGTDFTVRVLGYDNDGTATPASGASVRYGASTATAGADGVATLRATGEGSAPVSATRAGAVRSEVRQVCSFTVDPSVCGIDPSAPVCRPAPASPAPSGRTRPVPPSAAHLRGTQRIAQAAIRRARAVEQWLDAGLVDADLCGGAIGPSELGPGVLTGAGPATARPEASPRPVMVAQAPEARGAVALTAAQLRINQRIAQAAIYRANAVAQRLAVGLTGGDVRDGEITAGTLARGLTVVGTTPAPAPAPSTTPRTALGRPHATLPITAAQLAVNRRIALVALLRTNATLTLLRSGLGPAQIRDGSITAADLAPALRGGS